MAQVPVTEMTIGNAAKEIAKQAHSLRRACKANADAFESRIVPRVKEIFPAVDHVCENIPDDALNGARPASIAALCESAHEDLMVAYDDVEKLRSLCDAVLECLKRSIVSNCATNDRMLELAAERARTALIENTAGRVPAGEALLDYARTFGYKIPKQGSEERR